MEDIDAISLLPAVLGTAFVLLLNKMITLTSMRNGLTDLTVYAGVLLIFYFTISYLINNDVEAGIYSIKTFGLDLVEIVLIFLAFYALGYLTPGRSEAVHLRQYYLYIAAIPVLEQFWNRLIGIKNIKLWCTAGCMSGLSIFGATLGFRWPLFNVLILLVFFLSLIWYLIVLLDE